MTEQDKAMAAMALSKPAQRLWARVSKPEHWYRIKFPHPGSYMQELIDAGLVTIGGRVNMVSLCYVPVGTKPPQQEIYPS